MNKVLSLSDYRQDPHLTGEARCMICKHEWIGVCPLGIDWIECPSCHSMKGLMKYAVERDGLVWECHCGNNLFKVTPDGYYCPNCGDWQVGF